MYPYIKFDDETEVTYSNIIEKDGVETAQIHFERPKEYGFDTARCELPTFKWLIKEGYQDYEIKYFEEFLKNNVHLFFKYSKLKNNTSI